MSASEQSTASAGFAAAVERGREARQAWVLDGVVLSTAEFARARGVGQHLLAELRVRGDLFAVVMDGETWWPAELLKLTTEDAAALCHALGNADDSRKLVFLMRRHGALGGRTVAKAIAMGRLADALRLAAAWNTD